MQSKHIRLLLPLVALVACAHPAPDAPGSARVAVFTGALNPDEVADVVVHVSGAGIEPDITQLLARDESGAFVGQITEIPAGESRSFDATARDAQGVALYAGAVGDVTVLPGQEVSVQLLLQQLDPPLPFENGVPHFTALIASSLTVGPGERVELRVVAEDLDGDELAYGWQADAGTFDDASSPNTAWQAPDAAGPVALEVSATDPGGAAATAVFVIDVGAGLDVGGAALEVSLNTAPEVRDLRVSPTRLQVGQRALLSLDARDPDGDAMTRVWGTDCDGAFSADGDATLFELSAPSPSGECTLEVVLDDGRGGDNRASVTLVTGAGPEVEQLDVAPAGGIVITEVMPNPAALADTRGEWLELHNPTQVDVDLSGCAISDASLASHTLVGPLVVPAGGYAVLANDAAAAPRVDYVYAGVGLNNSSEVLAIACDGAVVDEVSWSSSRAGASLSLDPAATDAVDNDDAAFWCDAHVDDVYGLGDRGTPGGPNRGC